MVEAREEDVTSAPKEPKARTRLNLEAVKEAVASGSGIVVAAQVHAPQSTPTKRKSPRKKPASAPKGE